MHQTLRVSGGGLMHALWSLVAGGTATTVHDDASDEAGAPWQEPDGHDELDRASDLSESLTSLDDPDVALCKLSLTLDETRRPRLHKGSFDRDFDPIM